MVVEFFFKGNILDVERWILPYSYFEMHVWKWCVDISYIQMVLVYEAYVGKEMEQLGHMGVFIVIIF